MRPYVCIPPTTIMSTTTLIFFLPLLIVSAEVSTTKKPTLTLDDEWDYHLNMFSTTASPASPDDVCYNFTNSGDLRWLASPLYPKNYPPNVQCIRTITAPAGHAILLDFRGAFFEIEPSYQNPSGWDPKKGHDCPNDFLEIRDGKYGFSPLIGKFCGLNFPRGDIRALSGSMWLRFRSDDILEYRGFRAEFKYIPADFEDGLGPPFDCQFNSLQGRDDGLVNSGWMQSVYERFTNGSESIECVWKLRTTSLELQMRIFILKFRLGKPNDCSENFMEIYAGTTADNPVKRFCGLTAGHVVTGWGVVYVRIFSSAAALKDLKISALYSAYTISKNCSEIDLFSCGDDSCIPDSLVCNHRANCLYARDELECTEDPGHSSAALEGPYLVILLVICAVIVAIILCAVILNFCPRFRRQQEKYDQILKELAQLPPNLDKRRYTVPSLMPQKQQSGDASTVDYLMQHSVLGQPTKKPQRKSTEPWAPREIATCSPQYAAPDIPAYGAHAAIPAPDLDTETTSGPSCTDICSTSGISSALSGADTRRYRTARDTEVLLANGMLPPHQDDLRQPPLRLRKNVQFNTDPPSPSPAPPKYTTVVCVERAPGVFEPEECRAQMFRPSRGVQTAARQRSPEGTRSLVTRL